MNKTYIKSLLENYATNEAQTKFCESQGIELTDVLTKFAKMKDYIKVMDEELQMVIHMVFIDKYSLRRCARECHFCYKTVIRKRDKAIEEITKALDL